LPKLTDESKSRIFFSFSSDIAYVRWHGRGKKMWYNYRYSKDELAEWMPRIKEMSRSTQVYGYFNNHNHGYAPENCLGYSVYIDLKKWFILHDCGDWRRTQRERRFCKHIGGLMLALPEDATRGVLDGIKRQMWEFSQYTGRGEA
jgi:hypothetical protein